MKSLTTEKKIYYTLRLAAAMCFIGHGAFGIITKQIWCNYFGVFGIGTETSYRLMPVIGVVDIVMGITLLIYPLRILAVWLVFWGLLTALLRPLSGEPVAEFVERAGNYGAPLALLMLTGQQYFKKGLFKPLSPDNTGNLKQVIICLRVVVFMVLAGHGWLNLIEKQALLNQYSSLGFSNPGDVAKTAGIFEIAAACLAAAGLVPEVLIVFFAWKVLTEAFYPAYPVFEWIERGGSYGSILALWFADKKARHTLQRMPGRDVVYRNLS